MAYFRCLRLYTWKSAQIDQLFYLLFNKYNRLGNNLDNLLTTISHAFSFFLFFICFFFLFLCLCASCFFVVVVAAAFLFLIWYHITKSSTTCRRLVGFSSYAVLTAFVFADCANAISNVVFQLTLALTNKCAHCLCNRSHQWVLNQTASRAAYIIGICQY